MFSPRLWTLEMCIRDRPRTVEVVLDPHPFRRRRQNRRRQHLLAELAGRSQTYNQGGSSRRQLMTAYREAALLIVKLLAQAKEPLAPKALRDLGASPQTGSILYKNYYGWFTRVDRGLYTLSEEGRQALVMYKDIMERLSINKEGDLSLIHIYTMFLYLLSLGNEALRIRLAFP